MMTGLKSSEYVLPLADPGATLETVGGKGASLARLVAAGLPVPGGFHVTTAAYWRFVADNELQSRIETALKQVDVSQPATLESTSQAIGELFAAAQTPPDVASDIALAYASLSGERQDDSSRGRGRRGGSSYTVRSLGRRVAVATGVAETHGTAVRDGGGS